MTWRPWRQAMADALYGPAGFYRRPEGPAGHFRTSVHASPAFAAALARLAAEVDAALGHPDPFHLVDVGAGRGELLRGLAGGVGERWRLIGVDVVPAPADLPAGAGWCSDLTELPAFDGLLVANEWLDNVPVDVVSGGRLVLVDPTGAERPGPPAPAEAAAWLDRWWPGATRAEVGTERDALWATAVSRVRRGVALAVDYAVDPVRHRDGTLTGYRGGRQVAPVPDGSCDLTAHVHLGACAAAGAAAGAGATALLDQRPALRALGVTGRRPPVDAAGTGPRGYLAALQRAGEEAELLDPDGLGGFRWLVQAVGVPLPPSLARAAAP